MSYTRASSDFHKDAIRVIRSGSASSHSSAFSSPVASNPQLSLDSIIMSLPPAQGSLLSASRNDPETPSSTIVEYGEFANNLPSAAELVAAVAQSQASLSPRSDSSAKTETGEDPQQDRHRSKSRGPPQSATREHSRPERRAQSSSRETRDADRNRMVENGLASDRVNRFFQSMTVQTPIDPDKELLVENRGLYQRVAALQRVERELLAETQELSRQLSSLKQHHAARRQHWREETRKREIEARHYEAEMKQMEATRAKKLEPLLTDDEIAGWFEQRDSTWYAWAESFAHRDPDRLTDGLHPMQLLELHEGVSGFVQLTDDGKLPQDLRSCDIDAARTLLHGMLANFIISEAFSSPYWVFDATSAGVLESPATTLKPTTPGLRMDLNLFSDISPIRQGHTVATPGSPHYPPPLITSMLPRLGITASSLGVPVKHDFDNLHRMLARAQPDDAELSVHDWRAHTMRLFAEGGISIKDPASAGRNEAQRTLIESRLNYTRKVKDRFLGGPARFLLAEQDARGIERLERTLFGLIDDALRFSCRVWSRPSPVRLHGWKEFGGRRFSASSDLMTVCQAQVLAADAELPTPTDGEGTPSDDGEAEARARADLTLARSFEGRPVIMVAQPAVETIRVRGEDDEDPPRVWMKSRVLVATVQRARAPKPIEISRTLALSPSTGRSLADTPSEMTRDSATSPDTPKRDAALPTPNESHNSSAATTPQGTTATSAKDSPRKSSAAPEPGLPSTVYGGETKVMSA
ncbi:hypothetical protein QBC39DRAFT_331270 [Podospora conica]|nr:hypothetical protein QBC39DRAFT_331270 [Schizothecium conicum]